MKEKEKKHICACRPVNFGCSDRGAVTGYVQYYFYNFCYHKDKIILLRSSLLVSSLSPGLSVSEGVGGWVSWFPKAATGKGHTHSGFKQQKFVVSRLWMLVWDRRVGRTVLPLKQVRLFSTL